MSRYIDAGTARQHLTDRLMESALNNVGIKADADEVFRDIAENRLPVWIDELQTYDVQEVRHGRWIHRPVEEWGASNCKCSVCGTENFFPLLLKGGADNYCGNCGADMREAKSGCDDCFIPLFYNLEDDDSICRDCEVGE